MYWTFAVVNNHVSKKGSVQDWKKLLDMKHTSLWRAHNIFYMAADCGGSTMEYFLHN